MKKESETRQKLLDTATDLVWENSYGSVSVDDICERAGVKKGSFYHFFPSKSDLIGAAYEHHWQKSLADKDRIFSPQLAPLERFSKYCELVLRNQKLKQEKTGKVCGCPYGSLGSELSTQDEKLRHKAQEMFERTCRYFESAILDAQRLGLVPAEQDCAEKAKEVYSYVIGILLQAKIQNDLKVIEQLRPGLWRLIGAKEEAAV